MNSAIERRKWRGGYNESPCFDSVMFFSRLSSFVYALYVQLTAFASIFLFFSPSPLPGTHSYQHKIHLTFIHEKREILCSRFHSSNGRANVLRSTQYAHHNFYFYFIRYVSPSSGFLSFSSSIWLFFWISSVCIECILYTTWCSKRISITKDNYTVCASHYTPINHIMKFETKHNNSNNDRYWPMDRSICFHDTRENSMTCSLSLGSVGQWFGFNQDWYSSWWEWEHPQLIRTSTTLFWTIKQFTLASYHQMNLAK